MISPTSKSRYLPHVDGLRAIAVLVVIVFHIDATLLPGGYVGVDVFFVISGFLITGLLKDELEYTGSLKLKAFYMRRIRRLMPALLAMLLLTFLFSVLVFSPSHLQRSAGALSSSIFSVSNFYFWFEADYFDTSANLKPFLHTWSLSVEEQFYVIWPVSMLLIYRIGVKHALLPVILIVSVFSFFLNLQLADGQSWVLSSYFPAIASMIESGKSTIFYMLPFRVFEFGIGASLLWVTQRKVSSTLFYDVIFLSGLGSIIYSVVYFDDSLLFPYWYGLVPCIGAAFIIISGSSSRLSVLVSNPLAIWIGLVSYSLYLVHWPVIVFSNYLIDDFDVFTKVQVLVGIFVLAILLYKFVETPFRKPSVLWKNPGYSSGLALVPVFLLTAALHANASGGWQWRIEEPMVNFEKVGDASEFHRKYYGGNPGYMSYEPQDENSKIDIVLIGDSHSAHYAYGLNELFAKKHGYNLYIGGFSCLHLPGITRFDYHHGCVERTNQVLEITSELKRGSVVILSNSWDTEGQISRARRLSAEGELTDENVDMEFVIEKINDLAARIGEAKLVVIGNVPRAGANLYDVFTRPRPVFFSGFDPEEYITNNRDRKLEKINDRLEEASRESGNFVFIDPFDFLCDQKACRNIDSRRRPMYSDSTHLSKFGSIYMVEAMQEKLLDTMQSNLD